MTDPAKRERAALDVLDLLPEGGPSARRLRPRHRALDLHGAGPHPVAASPETITGTGEDELAAMIDLGIRLEERRRAEKLAEIDRRGRAAFLGEPRNGLRRRGPAADGRRAGAGDEAISGLTRA